MNKLVKRKLPKHQFGAKVQRIPIIRPAPDGSHRKIDSNWGTIQKMYDRAKQRGLSHNQIVGLLGNIAVETGGTFSPTQRQIGGGGGYGLVQTTNPARKKHMIQHVRNIKDLNSQFDYILDTFTKEDKDNSTIVWGGYNRQDQFMKNPSLPVEDSTALLTKLYFRPGEPHLQERQNAARYINSKLNEVTSNNMNNYLPNWQLPKMKMVNPPLLKKKGGNITKKDNGDPESLKKGGKKNWIQGAVNPAHKGYCTPMTKSTCTPKRKALARTFKKMAKRRKHEQGGTIDFLKPLIEQFKNGGNLSKEYIKKAQEKPGGSNVGKKTFASGEKRVGPYVGPSGGAPKGSYPAPDVAHAKAAIKMSGHAPNPSGIKSAVYKKYPQLKNKE